MVCTKFNIVLFLIGLSTLGSSVKADEASYNANLTKESLKNIKMPENWQISYVEANYIEAIDAPGIVASYQGNPIIYVPTVKEPLDLFFLLDVTREVVAYGEFENNILTLFHCLTQKVNYGSGFWIRYDPNASLWHDVGFSYIPETGDEILDIYNDIDFNGQMDVRIYKKHQKRKQIFIYADDSWFKTDTYIEGKEAGILRNGYKLVYDFKFGEGWKLRTNTDKPEPDSHKSQNLKKNSNESSPDKPHDQVRIKDANEFDINNLDVIEIPGTDICIAWIDAKTNQISKKGTGHTVIFTKSERPFIIVTSADEQKDTIIITGPNENPLAELLIEKGVIRHLNVLSVDGMGGGGGIFITFAEGKRYPVYMKFNSKNFIVGERYMDIDFDGQMDMKQFYDGKNKKPSHNYIYIQDKWLAVEKLDKLKAVSSTEKKYFFKRGLGWMMYDSGKKLD